MVGRYRSVIGCTKTYWLWRYKGHLCLNQPRGRHDLTAAVFDFMANHPGQIDSPGGIAVQQDALWVHRKPCARMRDHNPVSKHAADPLQHNRTVVDH